MEIFGMGGAEILLILIVALLIWGPGRLPEIARTLGKTVATLRKARTDLTAQVKAEIEKEEEKVKQAAPKPETPEEEPERSHLPGATGPSEQAPTIDSTPKAGEDSPAEEKAGYESPEEE